MTVTECTRTSRFRRPAIALLAVCAMALPACGDDPGSGDPDTRVVTVTGSGEVRGAPDTLSALIGVEASGPDVSSAISAVNDAAKRVTDAVKKQGVESKDIQTQEMSISPQYTGPAPGQVSSVGAYQASNTVRIVVRDLPNASKVLDAAIKAGGDKTRLNGVSFAIEDDSKLVSDARDRAFSDAKSRAEQYAKLADDSLGGVVSIDENVTGQQTPYTHEMTAKAVPVQIEPGEQTVRVQVTVKWRLKG
ncbi:MAG: SIMPL domain-containing protein [Gordonia sp. (in: high G+C Gram-positive bacteria)]